MKHKRLILTIFALFLLLFQPIVAFRIRSSQGREQISCHPVSSEMLMTGRDRPGKPRMFLLPGDRIDLNTASPEELMLLPGIGEVLAGRILEYREQTPFIHPEDIMNVKGIGEATYRALATLIRTGEES